LPFHLGQAGTIAEPCRHYGIDATARRGNRPQGPCQEIMTVTVAWSDKSDKEGRMLDLKGVRRVLALAFVGLLLPSLPTASAQQYPNRPVRLMVGVAAGGAADVVARLFAGEMSKHLGEPVFVDNRPGSYMLRPTAAVVRAAPDGYTLMLGTSEMAMYPYIKKDYPYVLTRDFTLVGEMADSWTVFAAAAAVPAKTLPAFIDYARHNPGTLKFGSGGVGGSLHVSVELLMMKAGISLIHIPFQSGAESLTALLGDQIDMNAMGLASAVTADRDKINVLAQAGPRRHPILPDVPTTGEYGFPDVVMETWFGLIGPPGMPPTIVSRLDAAIASASQDEDFRHKLEALGFAVNPRAQTAFISYVDSETSRWKTLLPGMHMPAME
jgi:tripartite-type tricarboxylate transporter receptor subunit TctC